MGINAILVDENKVEVKASWANGFLVVPCSGCKKDFQIKAENAGKFVLLIGTGVRCPNCGLKFGSKIISKEEIEKQLGSEIKMEEEDNSKKLFGNEQVKLSSDFYKYTLDITGLDGNFIPIEAFLEKIKSTFKFDLETSKALLRLLREKGYVNIELCVKKNR